MKGVSISIGNIDLLVDSHLRLKAGIRYGFLGRYALFLYQHLSKVTYERVRKERNWEIHSFACIAR